MTLIKDKAQITATSAFRKIILCYEFFQLKKGTKAKFQESNVKEHNLKISN